MRSRLARAKRKQIPRFAFTLLILEKKRYWETKRLTVWKEISNMKEGHGHNEASVSPYRTVGEYASFSNYPETQKYTATCYLLQQALPFCLLKWAVSGHSWNVALSYGEGGGRYFFSTHGILKIHPKDINPHLKRLWTLVYVKYLCPSKACGICAIQFFCLCMLVSKSVIVNDPVIYEK